MTAAYMHNDTSEIRKWMATNYPSYVLIELTSPNLAIGKLQLRMIRESYCPGVYDSWKYMKYRNALDQMIQSSFSYTETLICVPVAAQLDAIDRLVSYMVCPQSTGHYVIRIGETAHVIAAMISCLRTNVLCYKL